MSEKLKTFLLRYRYDGAEYGFDIQARDWNDARARLSQLHWAKIDGPLVMSVPGWIPVPIGSAVADFVCWLRNGVRWLVRGDA